MDPEKPLQFTKPRFSVEYHLKGTETEARGRAEALCLDQTVELPNDLIPDGPIRRHILGRVESFRHIARSQYAAILSFPSELLGKDITQVLSVAFGIASLKPGIRVARLDLSDELVNQWPGPRLGRTGLRERLQVQSRPLTCGVLKPVGLSPGELADLAHQFALGGLDLIKDDQGLVDQAFCPFDERIIRCAAAVEKANRETGRNCLYFPNVTGSGKEMYQRSVFAQQAGAGGVLLCPGLTGFDAIRVLAADDDCNLPVMSHPTFLGSFITHADSGIAPPVLFGQLPRLAGADISIYPTYGGSFPVTKDDCHQIATETAKPWGGIKKNFPTAAGRVHLDRVTELIELYGNDLVFVLGGEFLQPGKDVVGTCRTFVKQVRRQGRGG